MKKFLSFGDIHFSSMNPWNSEAGDNFIGWFKGQDFGNKDDLEMGLAGDITENDVNPGSVIDQVYRFISIASEKFKTVYITIGNHDKKLYHNREQHSLMFLKNFSNVVICDKETDLVTENGFHILFLPYQRLDNITLHDYYNNNLPESMYNTEYDIIFGHWNIAEKTGLDWMKIGVDISKFHTKCWSLGHIHTRERDEYLGSVYPNSIAEQDPKHPRGYKVLDENKNVTFIEIPEFLRYEHIKYGEQVPDKKENCAYCYIISECNSETEAESMYKDIHIKSIERPKENYNKDNTEVNADMLSINGESAALGLFASGDWASVFEEFIKETGANIPKDTGELIKTLLASPVTEKSS